VVQGIENVFQNFTFEIFDIVEDEKRGHLAARARDMLSLDLSL
jgi:hypothetical protein